VGITISIKQYIALVLNIKVHMKSQHSQSGTKPAYLILFMVSFIYNDSSDSENQNISACKDEMRKLVSKLRYGRLNTDDLESLNELSSYIGNQEPMQSYQLQDCQYTRSM